MKNFKKRLQATLEPVLHEHRELEVQDVAVGITYSAVLLENGMLGVSSSHFDVSDDSCFNAGKIHDVGLFHELGLEALVGKITSEYAIERSVGYAAVNALSQHVLHQESTPLENTDILDIVGKYPDEPIYMVGQIKPIFKVLKKKNRDIAVKDFKKGVNTFPDMEAGENPDGGILIITGSSLSNDTFGSEMETFKNAKISILMGPSAQVLPEWMFNLTRLDAVASMSFHSPRKAFHAIKQGGGTPNFVRHATKYTIFKEPPRD